MRNLYKLVVRIPEGKKPLVRPRHGWEDNIIMDIREIQLQVVERIHLDQDRGQWWALNTITDLQVR
jgi:hypothetical protein